MKLSEIHAGDLVRFNSAEPPGLVHSVSKWTQRSQRVVTVIRERGNLWDYRPQDLMPYTRPAGAEPSIEQIKQQRREQRKLVVQQAAQRKEDNARRVAERQAAEARRDQVIDRLKGLGVDVRPVFSGSDLVAMKLTDAEQLAEQLVELTPYRTESEGR